VSSHVQTSPPEGFRPVASKAPFLNYVGPIYERQTAPGTVERCFWAAEQHSNGLGLVHGGMLATFMDGTLALACTTPTHVPVTISLSMDYLRMARIGEWIVGEARILRATREMAFAEGRAHVGGVDVVRASGVFKLFPR
jgi:uncharacterized protein (TIGR00369 family)